MSVWDDVTRALMGTGVLGPDQVHVGHVPAKLPLDPSGNYKPYVVVWPVPGSPIDEEALHGTQVRDATSYRFLTNVAAQFIPTQLLVLAPMVADALTGLRVGGGTIKADIEQQRNSQILPDPDLSPTVFFWPLEWTLNTQ